jgi:hypothetical protein
MVDYTFHPEYVAPYYLLLMNANFVSGRHQKNHNR